MSSSRLSLAAKLVALTVMASACSSSPNHAIPRPTTVATVTSTTLDSVDQEVVAAYRRYWDVYIAVGRELLLPDPRVGGIATGEGLRQLNSSFLAAKAAGHGLAGTIELDPHVIEVNGDQAVVRDCYASHIVVINRSTGKPLGPERPGRTLVTVTMVREDENWKVAAIRHEGDGCTAAQ